MANTDTQAGPDTSEVAPPEQYEYVEEVVEFKDTRRLRTLLAIILVLLTSLLAYVGYGVYRAQQQQGGAAAVDDISGMVWVRSIYGWGAAADQRLVSPNTVAVGPDGLIWTNSGNRAAVAFNPDGSFDRILQSANTSATGEATQAPTPDSGLTVTAVFSLDVDGDNNLYVCDNAARNILQFTPEAGLKQGWSVPGVNKISVNDSRVVALTSGSIGVFDSTTGDAYFQFGNRGSGELEFDFPMGAHVDDENFVYVADTQNRRVRKFDPTGTLIWDAGTAPDRTGKTSSRDSTAAADSLFQLPSGVTTDANGRVVVADAFNYQLVVLDGTTGEEIDRYGDYGSADGLFNNPAAIVYDAARDYFVVADTGNNRLQVVRIQGSSKSETRAALRRLFDRPVWICGLPFLVLLIAAIVVALSRRRRKKQEAGAGAAEDAV
jgi:hypothetical protein